VVLKPGCLADDPILSSAHGLTANALPNTVFYTLYATDPQSNMVLLRYPQTPSDDAPYWPWGCFDSNLRPEQISAINIYDQPSPYNTPEVYATNAGGRLFVRRYFKTAWTQWEVMGLPRASSHLSDVAASSTPQTLPFVYVLDGGRLFTRRHASAQAYSDYTPWREIGGVPADAVRLCAGVGSDQRQQLFVLTQNGNVFDALQANGDPDAAFGEFQPSVQASSHAMADIDCGYLADGTLTVFGLSSGVVWFHSSGAPDSLDWTTEPSAAPSSFNVFAIGSRPNLAPSIFGIDSTNAVWAHLLGSSSWTPLY